MLKYMIIPILLLTGCDFDFGMKARPIEEVIKEYRDAQEMNEVLVNLEGHTCLSNLGTFTVNKTFGIDRLPIIKSWSCTYTPESQDGMEL